MLHDLRTRLIFHGSVLLLLALACGLPSVVEVSEGVSRMWQAAHSALLLMAVWVYAEAAILSLIHLKEHELKVLVWSLIAAGYGLVYSGVVQAITGERVFSPSTSVVSMSVFVANLVIVLGSVLTAALTLLGAKQARAARRAEHAAAADRVAV